MGKLIDLRAYFEELREQNMELDAEELDYWLRDSYEDLVEDEEEI